MVSNLIELLVIIQKKKKKVKLNEKDVYLFDLSKLNYCNQMYL